MPIIQNFDFSKDRPREKRKKPNVEIWPKDVKQTFALDKKTMKSVLQPMSSTAYLKLPKEFTRQELLVIKEAIRFFAKLNEIGDKSIQTRFKLDQGNFTAIVSDISNKIWEKMTQVSSDEITEESAQQFINEKPVNNKLLPKREDLINELKKMTKSERIKYWENLDNK